MLPRHSVKRTSKTKICHIYKRSILALHSPLNLPIHASSLHCNASIFMCTPRMHATMRLVFLIKMKTFCLFYSCQRIMDKWWWWWRWIEVVCVCVCCVHCAVQVCMSQFVSMYWRTHAANDIFPFSIVHWNEGTRMRCNRYYCFLPLPIYSQMNSLVQFSSIYSVAIPRSRIKYFVVQISSFVFCHLNLCWRCDDMSTT